MKFIPRPRGGDSTGSAGGTCAACQDTTRTGLVNVCMASFAVLMGVGAALAPHMPTMWVVFAWIMAVVAAADATRLARRLVRPEPCTHRPADRRGRT